MICLMFVVFPEICSELVIVTEREAEETTAVSYLAKCSLSVIPSSAPGSDGVIFFLEMPLNSRYSLEN